MPRCGHGFACTIPKLCTPEHGLHLMSTGCRSIAGTSAGSIVAVLLAAARRGPELAAGTELLSILLSMPASTFADGTNEVNSAMRCITNAFSEENPSILRRMWAFLQSRHLLVSQGRAGVDGANCLAHITVCAGPIQHLCIF